jgi:polar amino acid transport system substrate-binding protein
MTYKTLLALAICMVPALSTPLLAQERSLTIGTEGAYPPFNVVDNTGVVTGLDIDIGNAICAELKAKCTWVTQDFEGLIPALQNGRFDMIIASHSITDDRLKIVDMVRYYGNSAGFVARKDSGITDTSADGMAGRTVGAQSGTTHASYLEKAYAGSTLKLYPTQVEAYADLQAGRIDAVMGDTATLYDWTQGPEGSACCDLLGDTISDPMLGDGLGIILTKGNPLTAEVAAAIETLRANGTYDKLTAAYFPFSLW